MGAWSVASGAATSSAVSNSGSSDTAATRSRIVSRRSTYQSAVSAGEQTSQAAATRAAPMIGSRARSALTSPTLRYADSTSVPACPRKRTVDRWSTPGRPVRRIASTRSTVVRHGRDRVGAVGRGHGETVAAREHRADPAVGTRNAQSESVVLAHEQERDPLASVGRMCGPVQCALGSRVVQRAVAEAADDDHVVGPRSRRIRCDAATQREPDGAGEMRGDRRRLRNDRQSVVAEHLVSPAGDSVGRSGQHAAEDVDDRVARHRGRPQPPSAIGRRRTRPSGSGAGRGRRSVAPSQRWRCSRGRPSRSCSTRGRARRAASARCGRGRDW